MGTLKIKNGGQYEPVARGPEGPEGPAGPPNSLAIGTVATGAPGSQASATITGVAPTQTLSLTIPQGNDGPAGIGAPTGSLLMYGGSTAPSGYVLADGAALSRTTYSALFAVLGTAYGAGDGSTTFNVPDLRVRLPIGAGTGKTLGASDGVAEASRDSNHSHSHSHSASAGTYSEGPLAVSVTVDAGGYHGHNGSATTTVSVDSYSGRTGAPSGGVSRASGTVSTAGDSHNHDMGHGHTASATTAVVVGDSGQHPHTASGSLASHSHSAYASVYSNGSAAHPFAVVNYIVKT